MEITVDVKILYHRKDHLWVDWIEAQLKSRGIVVDKTDFSKGKVKNMPLWLHESTSDYTAAIVVESEEMYASGNVADEWKVASEVYGSRQIAAYRRKGLSTATLGALFSSSFIGSSENDALDAIDEFCSRVRLRKIDREKLMAECEGISPVYPGSIPRNWKMPYNEVSSFFGRSQELSDIEKKLRKSHALLLRSRVTGRGFGLTTMVAKAIYLNLEKYSTIWWLSAFDNSQLVDGLKELGQRYGVQGLSGGLAESFPKIYKAMQGKSKLPFLIVLERPSQSIMLEFEKLAETKWTGGIMIALDAVQRKDTIEELQLDIMGRDDVHEMITTLVGNGDVNVLEDIAGFLKFHPLLVTIAAGLIRNGRGAKTFIEDFQLEGQLVNPEKAYLKPFAILTRFVIDQLSFSNPDVEQLLTFSSYFAPLPIPACIFEKPDDFEIDGDLFNRIIYDPRRLSVGLNKLAQYGLINLSGSSLVMHPLISESVTSMPEYRKDWPERITEMLSERLSSDLPADLLEERRSQIYPHMVDICTNIIRSGNITEEVLVLINNVANQAKSLQNWALATELLVGLQNYFVSNHGEDNDNVANISSSLGVIYKLQNNIVSAKEMFEKSLRIDKSCLGDNHNNVAEDYCQLARIYELENRMSYAVEYFKTASDIFRANLGDDHPKYAKVLGELIGAMKKNKQTSEIYDYAKTVVEIEKKVYGASSPKIVHSMVNVGFAAVEKQRYDEALDNFRAGMEIEIQVYGASHIRPAKMLVLIGNVYERMGNKAGAKENFEKALPVFTATLGSDHPSLAAVKSCLERVS